MKALTVQQPWATAIAYLGKGVENRSQAWRHRGDLAIHAGKQLRTEALDHPLIEAAWFDRYGWGPARDGYFPSGQVLAVVDVVDVHPAHDGCCTSPWAEESYIEHTPGGLRIQRNPVHMVLENVRSLGFLPDPIECSGKQGLWNLDEATNARVAAALKQLQAAP